MKKLLYISSLISLLTISSFASEQSQFPDSNLWKVNSSFESCIYASVWDNAQKLIKPPIKSRKVVKVIRQLSYKECKQYYNPKEKRESEMMTNYLIGFATGLLYNNEKN